MKQCRTCLEWKDNTAFHKNKNGAGGLHAYCKNCTKVRNRTYYQQAHGRERARNYYQQHRDAAQERKRAYNRANKEKVRERQRAWARQNRDLVNAANRAAYRRHIDARRARSRAYYRANPDRMKHLSAVWARTNRAANVAKGHRYRAKQAGATGTYTAAEWEALCARYGHRCVRCGEQRPLTVDHIVSLRAGGTNTIDNLQPLCGPCNTRKGGSADDYRS